MDLLQLKYFRTVASLEHMTRAAEMLHVSQPSLSRMISNLERELGAELFYRTGRKIHLTPSGKAFLQHVERSLDELRAGQNELERMKQTECPIVVSCGVAGVLTDLAEGFQQMSANSSVVFRQDPIESIKRLLDADEVDFVISDIVLADFDTSVWRVVSEERMYVLVSKNHPLAQRQSVCLADLEPFPLVMPESTAAIRRVLAHFFGLCGVNLTPVYEVNDVYVQLHLVENGNAISVLPSSALFDIMSKHNIVGFQAIDRVAILPVSNTNATWSLAVSPLTRRASHSRREEFYQFCLRFFEQREKRMAELLPPSAF